MQIRNMSASATANVTITLRAVNDPVNPCAASLSLGPNQATSVAINCRNNFTHTSGYIDANQEIAVSVINRKANSTIAMGAYTGVPATVTWGPLTLPHVARRLQTASGWSDSDIVLQNPTNTDAHVQVILTRSDLTTIQKDYWVSAFSSRVVQLQYESGISENWYGTWVHSLSNLPIDGYVQITNIYEPANSDTIMVYNAVTRP